MPSDNVSPTPEVEGPLESSLLIEMARRLVVPLGGEAWPEHAAAELADKYELGEKVGQGGMGAVYRAQDKVLGRTVAIKLLHQDNPRSTERFLREARAQAKVEHEHICHIYEVGTIDGRPFIAMQYVPGVPLGAARTEMSLEDKVRVVRDVALAIHAAHRVGLIHRDLKPSNILVERLERGGWRPSVLDFGIAREASADSLTMTGQVLGTPQYMSPEQALGRTAEVDRRTDVYALGATLYELLTGSPPFTGAAAAVLLKVIEADPTPPRKLVPELPNDLESIVLRCLRKAPQERYDSARALADDLTRYLEGDPIEARGTDIWYWVRKRARKNKALTVALATAILATIGVAVGLQVSNARAREGRVRTLLAEADRNLADSRRRGAEEEGLRRRAFELFDAEDERAAEPIWARALALGPKVELALASAGRALEGALAWDPERPETRAALADNLLERALLAERNRDLGKREDLLARLKLYDDDGARRRRFDAEAMLRIDSNPAGAEVLVSRYLEENGKLREGKSERLGATPLAEVRLPQGSYLLLLRAPGRATVRYPLLAGRGERLHLSLDLPRPEAVPEGLVYVPPGRFLRGAATEAQRRIRNAPPLHEATTGAYLIGRTEVTVAEWLEFLATLSPAERARRSPQGEHVVSGSLRVTEIAKGVWEYRVQPVGAKHVSVVRTGERLADERRPNATPQDWMRFAVTAISHEDAEAYATWLDRTARLPGARLCNRAEWERAARGADDREHPQGALDRDEAKLLIDGSGLDEVGSYPASRSAFGLDDCVGNAVEWTSAGEHGIRWIASQHYPSVTQVNAFQPAPPTFRAPMVGMRLCANFDPARAARSRKR